MENSISSDLIRGHIDTIILYSLSSGDKHVQQIIDCVYEKSEKKYELNQATLYSSLKRLEKENLLKAFWNDSENGRRRFFSITDEGKKFIEENLSNWSFSRSIIDKLLDVPNNIDSNPQEIIKEKIVYVPIQDEKKQEFDDKKAKIEQILDENFDKKVFAEKLDKENEEKENLNKEINFRNILNGLIKATEIVENNVVNNEVSIENSEIKAKPPIKQENLQEVIEKGQKSQRISKCNIDFSELEIKASKEGYKIRFSNVNYKTPKGSVLSNKLNFISSVFLSFLMLIEVLIISLTCKSLLSLNSLKIILSCIISVLPIVIFSIIYFKFPKTTKKAPKTNSVIAFLVVIFDFLLLLFVVEWLLNIDFSSSFNLVSYFLIPALFALDILFFLFIRKILSLKNYFIYK